MKLEFNWDEFSNLHTLVCEAKTSAEVRLKQAREVLEEIHEREQKKRWWQKQDHISSGVMKAVFEASAQERANSQLETLAMGVHRAIEHQASKIVFTVEEIDLVCEYGKLYT